MRPQGKQLSPKLERQVKTENHNLPEQKLTSRNHPGNQCQGRKTWTAINKLLESQCRQVWGKTLGGPCNEEWEGGGVRYILVSFTSRNSTRSSQWILEENPLLLQAREREKEPSEICQSTVFFLTKSLRRNYFTTAKLSGTLSEPHWPGVKEIPNSNNL